MSGDDFPSELRTLIPDELWHIRLQDKGCAKEKLPKQTYNKNKILGVGPLGEEVYYHGLSAIAIDYSKILANKKDLDQGWAQLPKNKTQVKDKLVHRLLAMRKLGGDGKYKLLQSQLINMCESVWGKAAVDTVPHHNDRTRVFGIVMTLSENREMYHRLGAGVTNRSGVDDPALSPKQIYNLIQLSFNNPDVIVTLPTAATDLENIEAIDPNDKSRIGIDRDCEYISFTNFVILYTSY